MQLVNLTSTCRYCRYYNPEGRRGGMCQKLGASVQGSWKACALALSPFAGSWEELEKMINLSSNETPLLPGCRSAVTALDSSTLVSTSQVSSFSAETKNTKQLLV